MAATTLSGMPSWESLISNLAQSPLTPVLLEGRDTLAIARRIHTATYGSRGAPFIAVDCTWLPSGEHGRRLFGSEGPPRVRRGLVEQAHGGTLFLEDIADLSHLEQARLADLLDEMRFRRIHGVRYVEVRCRFIASVRSGVSAALESRRLRSDLHARLSVFPIVHQ